jgi:hypothetical protein
MFRKVDQYRNNNQKQSDEFWQGSHEIGKKLIVSGIGVRGKLLVDAGIYFVFNESEMPFVTSDNPVVWTFKHIDELQMFNMPNILLGTGIEKNQKSFFCFCSLTPKIALVSSPLLKGFDKEKYQYWEISSLEFVFWMNFLTHISSSSVIISSKANPYGQYKDRMKKTLEAINSFQKVKGKQILFYTSNSRYLLNVEDYNHIFDNPIKSRIDFWTSDMETLKSIANDEFIESVLLYEDGIERGGARRLKFLEVSSHIEKPSIIIQF